VFRVRGKVHVMTAITTPARPADDARDRPSEPPARLALAPAGSAPPRLDGAWWPRSRDLTAELPPLAAVLDGLWERITRATVNPTYWPVIPRKVPVRGHVMHVGWFEEQDPHELMLLSYDVGRWDLLVIPPETTPERAAWLMAAGSDPLRRSTASQLMAQAGPDAGAVGEDLAARVDRDTNGGRHGTPAKAGTRD
jgi:Family of unknown function (DUF5994)